VDPDLGSVKNHAPDSLLVSVLDANREVQPNFGSYSLTTINGHVPSGIVVEENATGVTLRREEGGGPINGRSDSLFTRNRQFACYNKQIGFIIK
jgi:hypothetical protein